MNKEEILKNILEELQDAVDYPRVWFPTMDGTDEEEMANDKYLEVDKCKVLLAYIKQLQQENKQLKEELEKADSITQSCIFQGKEESKMSFRNCLNKMTDYKNRIDKAIEYIEIQQKIFRDYDIVSENQLKNLFEILRGDNNEYN